MVDQKKNTPQAKKGFFGKMFDKLDKVMQEKAKHSGASCCQPQPKKDSDRHSCCG